MNVAEMNSLRPQDRILFTVAKTTTKGTVLSVWRDDMLSVKWSDGTKDTLLIDNENAKMLTLMPVGRPRM